MTCTTCFQITKSFALVAEKVLLVCRFLRSPLALLWLIFPARLLLLLSSKSLERRTLASPLVDHYCCLASIMVQLKRHVSFYIPYLSCQLSERLIFLIFFFLLFFEITIIISFPSHSPVFVYSRGLYHCAGPEGGPSIGGRRLLTPDLVVHDVVVISWELARACD